MSNPTDPIREILRTAAYQIVNEAVKLADEIVRLRDELDTVKQIESSTLPCGHHYRNGVSEDGGKNSYCVICELKREIFKLRTVVNMQHGTLYDNLTRIEQENSTLINENRGLRAAIALLGERGL